MPGADSLDAAEPADDLHALRVAHSAAEAGFGAASVTWNAPSILLMLTFIDVILLGCNLLVLWINVKLYTEILKIGHIQNIGVKS